MTNSTSQRSWRQNLAQAASKATGTPGKSPLFVSARSLSLILLLLTAACNSKETRTQQPAVATQSPAALATPAPSVENYPTLVAQAQEVNDAFRRRDFARMADLTYAKVIEAAGGREKLITNLARGLKDMEAEGVSVLASTAEAPIQIVHLSGSIYAVVPTTLKVKAQDGIFKTESSMIGISSDNGASWTFIDAGGKDHNQLKKLLPAADKLNLPAEKEPVKLSST